MAFIKAGMFIMINMVYFYFMSALCPRAREIVGFAGSGPIFES